jgi:hypothetical protein
MSFKLAFLVGSLVVVSLATGIAAASAAETGTKTMPDSSIYPAPDTGARVRFWPALRVLSAKPLRQQPPRRELT